MKTIIRFLLLAMLLQSFQCNDEEIINSVTPQQLVQKKQEILDYINSFSCAEASGCNSIAFGAKPCGGPREYLVYPNTVNQATLENLVNEYYEMDNEYNLQTGAVSDCMVVSPPNNIDCINGVCTIIN
ncbi:MAG: hypothetical protein NWP90_05020 [Flavobacterium sp.]|nr:hypothetical protein [Flavobacterium sp.]